MPPTIYSQSNFGALRQKWTRVTEFSNDAEGFKAFVNDPNNDAYKAFGAYAMDQVKKFYPEIDKQILSWGENPGFFTIYLNEDAIRCFVSLSRQMDDVLVWPCWSSEKDRLSQVLDGAGCLRKLAVLARGARQGIDLVLPSQEDKAFMWKAPQVHPLQVLENTYQRIVHKAVQKAKDPMKAQSDTLSEFFIMDAGLPESFKSRPLDQRGENLSAVKMNHLIDTFYLFRLLVPYRVESSIEIEESLRVDLSSDLTKLLHNGDRAKMGWLSDWLTKKIVELGQKVNALNNPDRKVIFFLKGGRALNYFLGTPEKGENDWDTQVVIDPSLSAEEWYKCFRQVHDLLLVALKTFKTEFTQLVQQNSPQFSEYLQDKAGPEASEDEEVDENEASDISSLSRFGEHANCKAELIDIGIPRRDSESGLEEWTRLSPDGSLLGIPDVVYPHREYYLTEYLMMVRDAFIEGADLNKAPKRIIRLGLILKNNKGRKDWQPSIAALKETAKTVENLDTGRRELFGVMISQFVDAYNLREDAELAGYLDKECAAMISNPPKLSTELADKLGDEEKVTASDVFTAHEISRLMDVHWARRNDFFEAQLPLFDAFVSDLARKTQDGLKRCGAQFAVAGSYAARLHARHLRLKPYGLEPIRRILVKLQCPLGANPATVMNAVRETIKQAATSGPYNFKVTDPSDGDKQSLLFYWNSPVLIDRYKYAPLVMKIRVARQSGDQLPVLASIDGLPVLDLRYLAADYFKKTSKIDERGARRVLASASMAVSEMLSTFQFDSDDVA
jgi:hypothetical protein